MGRTAIYMIVGFSAIFLYFGTQMSDVKFQAMENSIVYYEHTQRMGIAEAAANFACAEIFQDTSWRTGFSDVSFNGGTFSVTTKDTTERTRIVTATGTYQDSTQSIRIILRPSSFSKFAYFSGNDPSSITWQTGDTVFGPFHSNTNIYTSGKPVFMDKVTVQGRVVKSSGSNPKFYGGVETGVSVPLPSDLSPIKDSALVDGSYTETTTANDTMWAVFKGDSITLTAKGGVPTTFLTSDLAPNGTIVFKGYVLHVSGTVSGQVSIASLETSITTTETTYDWRGRPRTTTTTRDYGGSVLIDDDIVYADDPQTNPSSTDILGLIADNSILVADNDANNDDGVTIQAAMFSKNEGFGAENYASRPDAGQIRLLGGITQHNRMAVGTGGGWGGSTGFHKSYHYDTRLKNMFPPAFPTTGVFEIVSWYE